SRGQAVDAPRGRILAGMAVVGHRYKNRRDIYARGAGKIRTPRQGAQGVYVWQPDASSSNLTWRRLAGITQPRAISRSIRAFLPIHARRSTRTRLSTARWTLSIRWESSRTTPTGATWCARRAAG